MASITRIPPSLSLRQSIPAKDSSLQVKEVFRVLAIEIATGQAAARRG